MENEEQQQRIVLLVDGGRVGVMGHIGHPRTLETMVMIEKLERTHGENFIIVNSLEDVAHELGDRVSPEALQKLKAEYVGPSDLTILKLPEEGIKITRRPEMPDCSYLRENSPPPYKTARHTRPNWKKKRRK